MIKFFLIAFIVFSHASVFSVENPWPYSQISQDICDLDIYKKDTTSRLADYACSASITNLGVYKTIAACLYGMHKVVIKCGDDEPIVAMSDQFVFHKDYDPDKHLKPIEPNILPSLGTDVAFIKAIVNRDSGLQVPVSPEETGQVLFHGEYCFFAAYSNGIPYHRERFVPSFNIGFYNDDLLATEIPAIYAKVSAGNGGGSLVCSYKGKLFDVGTIYNGSRFDNRSYLAPSYTLFELDSNFDQKQESSTAPRHYEVRSDREIRVNNPKKGQIYGLRRFSLLQEIRSGKSITTSDTPFIYFKFLKIEGDYVIGKAQTSFNSRALICTDSVLCSKSGTVRVRTKIENLSPHVR